MCCVVVLVVLVTMMMMMMIRTTDIQGEYIQKSYARVLVDSKIQ